MASFYYGLLQPIGPWHETPTDIERLTRSRWPSVVNGDVGGEGTIFYPSGTGTAPTETGYLAATGSGAENYNNAIPKSVLPPPDTPKNSPWGVPKNKNPNVAISGNEETTYDANGKAVVTLKEEHFGAPKVVHGEVVEKNGTVLAEKHFGKPTVVDPKAVSTEKKDTSISKPTSNGGTPNAGSIAKKGFKTK